MKYMNPPASLSRDTGVWTSSRDASPKASLRQRLYPLRLLILSLGAMGLGMLLGGWLLPLLPQDAVDSVLEAHLGGEEISFALRLIRLYASALPYLLILCCGGLTCFCRGVCAWVTCICGLREGCALWLLITKAADLSPTWLWGAYAAETLILLGVRLMLALSSDRLSTRFFDPRERLPRGRRGVSPLLARHLLICLIGLSVATAACGGYLCILYFCV